MNRSVSSEPTLGGQYELAHRGSLAAVKKTRKQIENDSQALANRLSLLQKEEAKIWKNLELAKTKAQELYIIKKRDADRTRERRAKVEESNMGTQGRQVNSMLIRRRREENIINLKEALQRQKNKEMQVIKRQSEMMKYRRQDLDDRIKLENRNRMLTVKKQELLSNFKKKAYFEDKMLRVKHLQQKKNEEEEDYKVMKELELLNMEKAEMEMIQRIQYAKTLQKRVYNDLESMLVVQDEGEMAEHRNSQQKSLTARETEPVLGSIRMRSLNGSMIDGTEEHDPVMKTQVQERSHSKPPSRGAAGRLSHR